MSKYLLDNTEPQGTILNYKKKKRGEKDLRHTANTFSLKATNKCSKGGM